MGDTRVFKVAVIGGGVAGLTAARHLQDECRGSAEIVVFEAQDRLGGRVKTDLSFGVGADADLGASWIHGASKLNPLYRFMVLENKESIHRTNFDNQATWQDLSGDASASGKRLDDKWIETSWRPFEKLMDRQEDLQPTLKEDISLEEHLNRINSKTYSTPEFRFHHSTSTEFDTGASADQISALSWNFDSEYPGGDALVKQGSWIRYQRLITLLSQGCKKEQKALEYRLGHVVKQISETHSSSGTSSRKYVVEFENGQIYAADYVIVAVPVGVLKARTILFNPPLPERKMLAIDRVGFGLVNKVILKFDRKFWVDKEFFGISSCRHDGLFNYWINTDFVLGTKVLIAVALGKYATFTEDNPDQVVIDEAMKHLRVMYPHASAPVDYRISRWRQDPFARGSYSFATIGMAYAENDKSRSTDWIHLQERTNNILFAGEHTDADYRGSIHGAYQSGLRAATEIIHDLKR